MREILPETSHNMTKDKEDKDEEEKSFETDTDFKNFVQVLHQFISLLHYFEHPDQSCHFNEFVKLPNSDNSSQLIEISALKDLIERNDSNQVYKEP